MRNSTLIVLAASIFLSACNDNIEKQPLSLPDEAPSPSPEVTSKQIASTELKARISEVSGSQGLSAFTLPASDDFDNIPQDPSNPITQPKVELGKLLFHETALSMAGVNENKKGTWSCASCHHADAGFKSGIKQGIGEGGSGFANGGASRILAENFTMASSDPRFLPDVQPVTSPTILNTAYQDVMLWNGQFGNSIDGVVNTDLPMDILATEGTPKAENARQLSGLETQVVAGSSVHRMKIEGDSVIQTNDTYIDMFAAAFPNGSNDIKEDVSKAIAAYERTILANESPFQLWLNGNDDAMTEQELRGGSLFFGDANCSACHTGPALSSRPNAPEDEIFFAIGFADFADDDPSVTGHVDEATSKGRGGFTKRSEDDYKFKVPTLYNLKDTQIFGHGGSFSSVREVVEYKNNARPQKDLMASTLDYRFVALGLSESDINDLVAFLEDALHDPNLKRYVPTALPSGKCVTVADEQSKIDMGCS